MAVPVAMQTALLLLNHLNEIVFPPLYPHTLSVHSLIPKKPALLGTSFSWVTVSSSVCGEKGTLIIKLQKSICTDTMAEMDDRFRWREIFQGKKKKYHETLKDSLNISCWSVSSSRQGPQCCWAFLFFPAQFNND